MQEWSTLSSLRHARQFFRLSLTLFAWAGLSHSLKESCTASFTHVHPHTAHSMQRS